MKKKRPVAVYIPVAMLLGIVIGAQLAEIIRMMGDDQTTQ